LRLAGLDFCLRKNGVIELPRRILGFALYFGDFLHEQQDSKIILPRAALLVTGKVLPRGDEAESVSRVNRLNHGPL
jgi:hypothetical protein